MHLRHVLAHGKHEFGVEARFDKAYFLLGCEDFLLIFLQFLGDIALGIDECLFADPLCRHLVLIGIADFEVVTEDIIEAYLEGRDSRCVNLALLDLQKVVLAVGLDSAQFVQFGIDTGGEDIRPSLYGRRIGHEFADDTVANRHTGLELFAEEVQVIVILSLQAELFDRLYGRECITKLCHLARADTSRCHFAYKTLHILDSRQLFLQLLARLRIAEEMFYYGLTITNRTDILKRECHPPTHSATAHRCEGLIEDVDKGLAVLCLSSKQFKITKGKTVQPHESVLLNTAYILNMAVLEVLRHVEIMEYRTSSDDTFWQLVDTKALEIGGVELFGESVVSRVRRHHPIVQFEGEVAVTEIGLKQVALAAHV